VSQQIVSALTRALEESHVVDTVFDSDWIFWIGAFVDQAIMK
jgi:hypothetical protein